jgi:competence protein ComEA
VAPSDLTSRPSRLTTVLGQSDDPIAARPSPGSVGPPGVWPPPRPEARLERRPAPRLGDPAARAPADDPPTVPDLLSSGPLELVRPEPAPVAGSRLGALLRRLVPQSWRDARLHPGRPAAIVLVIVAAGAAVVAAVGVWMERPRSEPVPGAPAVVVETSAEAPRQEPPASDAGSAPTATAPAPPPAPLVVSVSGKVHRPGLVEVPSGARVADVLAAAGGALPGTDLAGLNLARRVGDGEQVAVGVPPAPDAVPAGGTYAGPVGPGSPAAGPAAPAGKVDLNSATVAQLDALPGVGPVMATRIVEWRTRNGRFAKVEQLREIEGIGERRFGQLRELVTV